MKLKARLQEYEHFHPEILYKDMNDPTWITNQTLQTKAVPFELPLTLQDNNDILRFMLNFESRLELPRHRRQLSLAAPQIGILKRLIVFIVPIGRGVIQPFPRSIWLNPTYESITSDMEEDHECCLSVNMVGLIPRYRRIKYHAYDLAKKDYVEGEAQGMAARVIQHETDHLDGILISDRAPPEKFISYQEYRQKQKDRWQGKGWMHCIEELIKEKEELKSSYPPLPKTKKRRKKWQTKKKI